MDLSNSNREGCICIEAKGLVVLIRKPLFATKSPLTAADNLVYSEDKNRNSFTQLLDVKTGLIVLISVENRVKFSSTQLLIFPEHVLVQHQFL